VDKINGCRRRRKFMLHTGDISHLSKPEEFDTVDQDRKGANRRMCLRASEHDVAERRRKTVS